MVLGLLLHRWLLPLGDDDHLRLRGLRLAHSRMLGLAVVFLFGFALGRDGLLMILSLVRGLVDLIAAGGSVSGYGRKGLVEYKETYSWCIVGWGGCCPNWPAGGGDPY